MISLVERNPGFSVSSGAGLDSLLGNSQMRRFGALMVIDEHGLLTGVVTIEQLGRALQAGLLTGVVTIEQLGRALQA